MKVKGETKNKREAAAKQRAGYCLASQTSTIVYDRRQQLRGAPGSLLQKFYETYLFHLIPERRMMGILQLVLFWRLHHISLLPSVLKSQLLATFCGLGLLLMRS